MKIFQVDPSFFTLPYDLHLAKGLLEKGHDVQLIGRPLRGGESLDSVGFYHVSDCFYKRSEKIRDSKKLGRFFPFLKGVEHVWDSFKFLKHVKENKPDVIHFQWMPFPLCDHYVVDALRKIAPVLMTVHDTVPFQGNPTSSLQSARWKETLLKFDALIVHTEFSKKRLRKEGIPDGKVNVIPHGVLNCKVSGPRTATSSHGKKILLFGEIKHYKGVDILFHAFSMIPKPLRDSVRVAIVGRPRMDLGPLRVLAEKLEISSQIEWDLRYVPEEEISLTFNSADIVVFPYREIDASGALMLALPFGKPVVVSGLDGFREVFGDLEGACIFPPGDNFALSEILCSLLEDENFYLNSGRLSRELANTRFSWGEIAQKTLAIYADLKGGQHSRC